MENGASYIEYQSNVEEKYIFMLFISGMSVKSVRAIENIRKICEAYLADHFELEIIDIYQQKQMAVDYQIIATPTLLRINPLPKKIILGDLSNTKKVLNVLNITEQ